MLYYQEEEDLKKGRIVGGIAALAYFVVFVLLALLVTWTTVTPDDSGEGILINFGNVDEAAPGGDMAMNDNTADAMQATQSPATESDIMTQSDDEGEVPEPQPDPARRPTDNTPTEAPREVNRNALFPGRTPGSTSRSDGTGEGAGNQGNPAGSPEGAYDGTGTGTSGNSANLQGRSLVGSLPKPEYNARAEGRVIINITVDQQGRVTNAAYRSVGSNTNNSTLVNAALRAARQARFDVSENAPLSQSGTITYNFRMQ